MKAKGRLQFLLEEGGRGAGEAMSVQERRKDKREGSCTARIKPDHAARLPACQGTGLSFWHQMREICTLPAGVCLRTLTYVTLILLTISFYRGCRKPGVFSKFVISQHRRKTEIKICWSSGPLSSQSVDVTQPQADELPHQPPCLQWLFLLPFAAWEEIELQMERGY